MKMTRMLRVSMSFAFGAAMVLTLLAGSSAFAVEPVHKGVDMWMTVSGMARTSFAKEPIPAGFFCDGSQPFTGTVTFKGAPLATEPARALGDIDTVVRRLDDAVFDEKGHATTRIQLMALSLISTAPIETSCGKYNVAVHLDGEQPTTTMRILRTSALGGSYSAPLALNVKAVFTPFTGDPSARRELTTHIDLGPSTNSVWMYLNAPQYKGAVRIDTHGTGRADTLLPAASNFIPGVTPAVFKGEPTKPTQASTVIACPVGQTPYQACHCDPTSTDPNQSSAGCDHLHCIWTCVATQQEQVTGN
ncbi:MAG TPA: hypothetical protein VMW75_07615 [Thermoanaerobaculia bacterium]|nr:hypothetical protein [Thermoanaerobaculia bacterium]